MLGKTTTQNSRQGLTAQSTITGKQEFLTSTGGVLNSGATLTGQSIPSTGATTAATVQIVDGSGNQITSFGGGTQYTDGGTPPTHPIGPTLIYDNAGTWAHVSAANPLPVTGGGSYPSNLESTANSSTTTLLSGAVFTGTSENVLAYADVRVSVLSDVASAADGLSMQQSPDGTNWDQTDVFTVPAGIGKAFDVPVYAKFFRIVYTNGGTNQTAFRLKTVYHISRTKPSSQRPSDSRPNDNDMEENLAYGMVYDSGTNTWSRSSSGNGTTGLGTQRVTLSSDSTGQVKLAAGSAAIGSLTAGTAIIGNVRIDQTTAGTTNGVTPTDGTNPQLFLADNVDNIAPSATANKPAVTNRNFVYGSSAAVWERQRRIENTMSTTGQGVAAAGMVAQFDDVAPTSITENQFGPARFSANRNLYFTIRDAAGNERGVNVSASNALLIGIDQTTLGTTNNVSTSGFDGTNYQHISVSTTGIQYIQQRADTATLSNVASSATSVTVLAANTARKGAQIYNDSTQICYIKFGTTASTTSFTVPLAAATYYELPAGYTGRIDGIWVSANGNARVTEET